MSGQGLSPGERLKGREAIQVVIREGRSVEEMLLIVRYLPRDPGAGRRFAVAVSRGVRPAVRRNLVRRRLRELWRRGRQRLPADGDYVLMGRTAAATAPYRTLEQAFDRLCDALAD